MPLPSSRELLLSVKAYEILVQIPPAPDYITAKRLSEKTQYSVRTISATIKSKLHPTYVTKEKVEGGFRYSRLPIKGFIES